MIDEFSQKRQLAWGQSFSLADVGIEIAPQEELESAAHSLLSRLASLVREFKVFVPLMGVELVMPDYDLGPVKLFRTQDSLPILDQSLGAADFKYVHPDIMTRFESFACLVELQIIGDNAFALEEGLRLAGHLAAILNLHFAQRSFVGDARQKIRCVGVPSAFASVRIVRVDLPDETGCIRPTYLPSTSMHSIATQKLNATDLNMVKELGFDTMWDCFADRSRHSDERCRRLNRAVSWFDKAVNFDEPDAQFVGLAIALEILLVHSGDIKNPFSSWAGISQQLAERCAFLLGHDLRSTKEFAVQAKRLYGIRSRIVHEGVEPRAEDVEEMLELTSRIILDFAQRDFKTFDHFEEWLNNLKFSVSFNEIKRYRQSG
jgi:hypothetical protein